MFRRSTLSIAILTLLSASSSSDEEGDSNKNSAPTNLIFASLELPENVKGHDFGHISVTDRDIVDSHTFEFTDDRFEVDSGKLN